MAERIDWAEEASCKGADPELFFPGQGDSNKEAMATCAGCLVATECLDYALENNEKHGIWGGATERERRYIRRLKVGAEEYKQGKQNGTYTYRTPGRPRNT